MEKSGATLFNQFLRTWFKYTQQQLLQQRQSPHPVWQQQQTRLLRTIAATCAVASPSPSCIFSGLPTSLSNSNSFISHSSPSPYPANSSCLPLSALPSSFLFSHPSLLRSYSKFTAAREPPNLGSLPLCEERAQDLISNLKDSEREAIKTALQKYEAIKRKEGFEGKLAATQWRTRFGRLSQVPTLGEVDPTGSYCAFPDEWLKKKAAERAKEPTSSDLWKIFFVNAVPFVGFGFLDNFTMIIAGDYIEYAFGTFMSISTMAAAGLGNTISDVLGIGSAYYVERGCEFLGLKPPDLTPIQMEMRSSRRSANWGRIIGITVGCLVGMFPLFFIDKKPTDATSGYADGHVAAVTTVAAVTNVAASK